MRGMLPTPIPLVVTTGEPLLPVPPAAVPDPPPAGTGWSPRQVHPDDLLAEAPERAQEWMRGSYARLMLAARGLVALMGPSDDEAAGWAGRLARVNAPVVRAGSSAQAAHAAFYPAAPVVTGLRWGVGSPAPLLVVVGERDPRDTGRPFLSRSGFWLLRALRCAGYDELGLYVTNAYRGQVPMLDALAALRDAFGPHDPVWVALGGAAAKACARAEVHAVKVEHPMHARRFAFESGPEGYAARLVAAGLPPGPYGGPAPAQGGGGGSESGDGGASLGGKMGPAGVFPTLYVAERARVAVADALGLPATVGYRKADAKPTSRGVKASLVERARRFYVTGQADTVRDASALAGIAEAAYPKLNQIARDDDWESERSAQARRVREQFYRDSADAEVKALVASRRVVSGALLEALNQVHSRLREGEYVPKALDAESLARTMAILADHGGAAGTDAETAALRALPMQEQAKRLLAALKDQFGIDAPEKKG